MSPVAWLIVFGVVPVALVVLIERADQRSKARRRAREQQRMHEAYVKATKLVIDFEHTPVRGASRDRSQRGKARRAARRS